MCYSFGPHLFDSAEYERKGVRSPGPQVSNSVADPHHIDADPDPDCNLIRIRNLPL
jgi:hypothetical protein